MTPTSSDPTNETFGESNVRKFFNGLGLKSPKQLATAAAAKAETAATIAKAAAATAEKRRAVCEKAAQTARADVSSRRGFASLDRIRIKRAADEAGEEFDRQISHSGVTEAAAPTIADRVGFLKANAARAEATASEMLKVLGIDRASVFDAAGKFLADSFETEVAKNLDLALARKTAETAPAPARVDATPTLDAHLKAINADFAIRTKPKSK
jgi:hypothetical protein